jgi:hypothetical protein
MLHDWTNLFNITGAAGAQLIGLLFVVVTLGSGWSAKQSEQAIRAFVTPTLVSFSGCCSRPWWSWRHGLPSGRRPCFWCWAGWAACHTESTRSD